jgi:histidinol-phosphate aminotransferase
MSNTKPSAKNCKKKIPKRILKNLAGQTVTTKHYDMNYTDLAPAHIRAIALYQPGKPILELERELGITGIVKLASNENPLGVSPAALTAMQEAIKTIALYPDGNGFELKDALAKRYGVTHANIFLGNGSNDLLELAARAFLMAGDKTVYSAHSFAVYALATQAVGATGIIVPAQNFGHDLDAMSQAAVEQGAKIIFIANPNNPTGTFLPGSALHEFLRKLPANILVVLDEAYNEYLPEEKRYDSVAWLREFPNLIISRTFSKAYGLAGLRVGYALAHEQVADMLNRVRQPFNVNSVAQAAAVAALADTAFVHGATHARLARSGFELYPLVWEFCQLPRRQCGAHLPPLTRRRRDRPSYQQLRDAGLFAREHRIEDRE